jgi:hypothetical protein
MVGYGIRQIRMVYLVGFTALLLAGSGVKGFAVQSSGEEHSLLITGNPPEAKPCGSVLPVCAPWFLGTQELCSRPECPSKNRK